MYKLCKTEKSAKRQKQFQETLLVMMGEQSYSSVTVTALCEKMGTSRRVFYRYFDTLEDVLHAAVDEVLAGAYYYLEAPVEIVEFFRYWKEHKAFLDIMAKNGQSQKLNERSYVRVLSNLTLDKVTTRKMRHAGSISAILTIVVLWHHSGMKNSPEEMADLMVEMFGGNSEI